MEGGENAQFLLRDVFVYFFGFVFRRIVFGSLFFSSSFSIVIFCFFVCFCICLSFCLEYFFQIKFLVSFFYVFSFRVKDVFGILFLFSVLVEFSSVCFGFIFFFVGVQISGLLFRLCFDFYFYNYVIWGRLFIGFGFQCFYL